jgi:hypothetical protein
MMNTREKESKEKKSVNRRWRRCLPGAGCFRGDDDIFGYSTVINKYDPSIGIPMTGHAQKNEVISRTMSGYFCDLCPAILWHILSPIKF